MIGRRLRIVALLVAVAAVGAGVGLALAGGSGGSSDGGASPTTGPGANARIGQLRITNAIVRTTTNDVTSLYFTVDNAGDQPDRVIAVSTDITSSAMLHQDVVQGASSVMQPLTSLDIPAHGQLVLKAGAYHVMLMDIKQPLRAGATVQARITFEKAGTVPLTVPVVPYGQ